MRKMVFVVLALGVTACVNPTGPNYDDVPCNFRDSCQTWVLDTSPGDVNRAQHESQRQGGNR